jgi:hypothetical protein
MGMAGTSCLRNNARHITVACQHCLVQASTLAVMRHVQALAMRPTRATYKLS